MEADYDEYSYLVVSQAGDGPSNYTIEDNAWEREGEAHRWADREAEKNPSRNYAVVRALYTPKPTPKETIEDFDGKEYEVHRGSAGIRIVAPCGQEQTFSHKELSKLTKGE